MCGYFVFKKFNCCSLNFPFTCQHFQTKGHSNSFTSCVTFSSSGSFLLLLGGNFWLTYCSAVPAELFLKCLDLLYEKLQTQRWKESIGPEQTLCVECLMILIKHKKRFVSRVWLLKLNQCSLHLLIIMICVVTLVYYSWVWAWSLLYFSSFERNENEVKCSLINLKV